MNNEMTMQDKSPTLDESDILPLQQDDRTADNPMGMVLNFLGLAMVADLTISGLEAVGDMGGGLDMIAITPQEPLPTFDNGFNPNMTVNMGTPTPSSVMG